MAERIEIGYTPAAFVGDAGIYHKYILYTDSEGKQFYARGGPGYFGPGANDGGRSESSSSPLGNIKTRTGEYIPDPTLINNPDWDPARDPTNPDPNAIPHPRETIKEGDDLSQEWNKIKETIDSIDSKKIPYDPRSRNSNSTVDEALREAGLPAPQKDGPTDNWAPGSDFDLPGGDVPGNGDESRFWDDFEDWFNDKTGWEDYKRQLEKDILDALLDWSNTLNRIPSSISDLYSNARNFVPRSDPLTLDLDNDGLETIGISTTSPILFDHDGDGTKTATGWVKSDDAFLVFDRNGNGVIENGRELFGDSTPLNSGGNATDGFAALAQEDTNSDGVVNNLDARWASLRLWRDMNQDGVSQSSELFSLQSQGVAGLVVAKTANSQLLANGNQIADLGHYLRTDGTEGTIGNVAGMADVNLASNPFFSEFTDAVPLSAAAQGIAGIQGSGMVRNLREAASLDGTLVTQVSALSSSTTRTQMMNQLDGIIARWADTSTMETSVELASDKGYLLRYLAPNMTASDISKILGLSGMGDSSGGGMVSQTERDRLAALTQELERINELIGVLERFNGLPFVTVGDDGVTTGTGASFASTLSSPDPVSGMRSPYVFVTINAGQLNLLEQSYAQLKESVYGGLAFQTRLKPYLDQIELVRKIGTRFRRISTNRNFKSWSAPHCPSFRRTPWRMRRRGWYSRLASGSSAPN